MTIEELAQEMYEGHGIWVAPAWCQLGEGTKSYWREQAQALMDRFA